MYQSFFSGLPGLVVLFFLWIPIAAWAPSGSNEQFEVQPQLQAALFKKILAMSARSNDVKPTVLVLYDARHQEDAASMARALEDLGLTLQISKNGQMPANLSGVVGAFLSAPNSEALNLCAQNGILTMTGYRAMVASGRASVTIVNEGGKPKPMINKARLKAEKKSDLIITLSPVSIVVE